MFKRETYIRHFDNTIIFLFPNPSYYRGTTSQQCTTQKNTVHTAVHTDAFALSKCWSNSVELAHHSPSEVPNWRDSPRETVYR